MVRERQQESEKISDFASRLRKARELLGITQENLGKSWGKTGNYIYMLEAGIKPVSKKLEHKVIELETEVRKKFYAQNEEAAIVLGESSLQAPVVSWGSAGTGEIFGEVSKKNEEQVVTDCPDENKYALIVEGDSMSPKLEAGDRIVVAPNSAPKNGDVVVARLNTGEVLLKLYHETHAQVRLTSFNNAYPPLDFRKHEFRFIQPVYALVRKLRSRKSD